MSGMLASLAGAGVGTAMALLMPRRRIGTIIPHVTVEEVAEDQLVITEHPVQQGAAITDHAYRRPTEVRMKVAWSNASPMAAIGAASAALSGSLDGLVGLAKDDFVKSVYEELLALQRAREPFTLTTGKKTYPNMLVAGLVQTTDRTSEYALQVEATFREVVLTSVSATMTDPATQSAPQETQVAADRGPVGGLPWRQGPVTREPLAPPSP